MNNTVKTYTSIAVQSLLKGALIAGAGIFLSAACGVAAVLLMLNNEASVGVAARAGIAGTIAFMWDACLREPFTGLLLLTSLVFVYLYGALAVKTSLQNSVYLLWQNKLSDYFTPRIASYIKTLRERQPAWLAGAAKTSILKMKLIEASRNDKEINPVQRRALRYGLKKAGLENIYLDDPDFDLAAVIANRIKIKIAEVAQPSLLFFWLLAGVQIVLLVAALVRDGK